MTLFDYLCWLSIILSALFIYLWMTYNGLVRKLNQVQEDFSDIDIQLKRRADLINNLVEVVKNYAKHEKAVFTTVAKYRSQILTQDTMSDMENANHALSNISNILLALAERYPELKADKSYQDLMNNMKDTEDSIAIYREEYNKSVKNYNNTLFMFPGILTAKLFNFTQANFFEYSD